MSPADHYQALFAKLQSELGELSRETTTGIVGFRAGGPVSIKGGLAASVFVTCELSLYPEQFRSTESEKFELMTRLPLEEGQARALLTALGNLSMRAQLGQGHTVDVSGVSNVGGLTLVRLNHYSSSLIEEQRFGVYEVVEAQRVA
jgi:hypothetical protein